MALSPPLISYNRISPSALFKLVSGYARCINIHDLRARNELAIVSRMPLHVLCPGCVVVVRAHHGIIFVHAPVKHFDTPVSEAC